MVNTDHHAILPKELREYPHDGEIQDESNSNSHREVHRHSLIEPFPRGVLIRWFNSHHEGLIGCLLTGTLVSQYPDSEQSVILGEGVLLGENILGVGDAGGGEEGEGHDGVAVSLGGYNTDPSVILVDVDLVDMGHSHFLDIHCDVAAIKGGGDCQQRQ